MDPEGNKSLLQDGTYSKVSRFWSTVAKMAEDLVGSEVRPGFDYALTEVVHCKSEGEQGVKQSLPECSKRYLDRVLAASGARVLVVLGKKARKAMLDRLELANKNDQNGALVGPGNFYGRERLILFMPHPNARQERTVAKVLSKGKLEKLQAALEQ